MKRNQGKSPSLSLSPLLSLLVYALLAIILTHPLWLHLDDAVPGDIGDPLLNTWILAWDVHALLTDPLHLFDANIFYPLPNTLAYSEHLFSTGILALPLAVFTAEPVVAYNFSLLLSFPLAGLGMYLLVLHWTHRRGTAFLAGLVFAFTPYRLAAISHLQLLTFQWLPFSLLAMDRLLDQGVSSKEYGVVGGKNSSLTIHLLQFVVFTSLQVLAGWYLAVFTALVLGLYTLGWLGTYWKLRARSWRLVVAALVVIGLTLPFALPYLNVLPQLQAARPASLAASFATWPTDFLTAAPYLRFAGPLTQRLAERPGFTEENTLFIGVVAPLLALAGLALALTYPNKAYRWRAVTFAAILAASLALTFGGPYLALMRLLPALAVVRVPPRWIIPATFSLAALVGLGVARIGEFGHQVIRDSGNRELTKLGDGVEGTPGTLISDPPSSVSYLVFVLVVTLLLVVETFAAPLPLASVGPSGDLPPVYKALHSMAIREPGQWGVVELPIHVAPAPEFPETKRQYASTLGWWGLVNGYSGFTPERQVALDKALAGFPDEGALEALRALGSEGVRYLIVHPEEAPSDRTIWETIDRWRAERQTSLLPMGRFGSDYLYLINPYGDSIVTDPDLFTNTYWSARTPIPTNVRFIVPYSDFELRLLAYQISNLPAEVRLTLYWQASAPVDTDYTVFVHSLNGQGDIIDQADGPPLENHYPATDWRPGEIVQDSRLVPPGDSYLVGLYNPVSGERLPAFAVDGPRLPNDAVFLTIHGQ